MKIKGRYKLELQMLETMKLFDSTKKKKKKDKTKNGESALWVGDIVLGQCNLIDSQYQEKSEVVYTFRHNKPYAYLINIQLTNLFF